MKVSVNFHASKISYEILRHVVTLPAGFQRVDGVVEPEVITCDACRCQLTDAAVGRCC